jgi:nucleoid DNA-binding protein
MEKHILALLNSNLRVIIPEFGAFIIKQKQPRIVVFNEFLRYNDGLLIEYISKTEGIELDMARKLVEDYVAGLVKLLSAGKRCRIRGIGTLEQEESGKLLFDSDSRKKEAGGTEDTPAEPVKQEVRTEGFVAETIPEPSGNAAPEPERETVAEVLKEPALKSEPEPIVNAPKLKPSATEPARVPDSLPPGTKAEDRKPPAGVKEPSKPKVNLADLIVKLIIVIILANAAVIAWFVLGDDIRQFFSSGSKETVESTDTLLQNLQDSFGTVEIDTMHVFAAPSQVPSASGSARYYIVAGCFRDEVNADELVKSLQSKGFQAEKFGKIGNLYAVSFASFESQEKAVLELKRIREEVHPEAWMTQF